MFKIIAQIRKKRTNYGVTPPCPSTSRRPLNLRWGQIPPLKLRGGKEGLCITDFETLNKPIKFQDFFERIFGLSLFAFTMQKNPKGSLWGFFN
jgi:hypothetical protein